MESHLPLPAEQVARLDPVVGELVHHLLRLVDGDGRVGRADVNHPAGLTAVQVLEALDRLCAVERENRVEVPAESAVAGVLAPALALVGAEVPDLEGVAIRDVEQTLAGRIDREAAKVTPNPPAVQLLGDDESCPRSTEEVSHEIPLIGGRADDTFS